jgi:repressor LexA
VPAPLTPLERKVYHFILDHLAERSYQPSVREIGRHARVRSTKSVAQILASLEEKGYVVRNGTLSRALTVVGYTGPRGTQPLPVYARARAAPPTLRATDEINRYALDRRLVPADDAFMVRVSGDVPLGGVADGDLVVVSPAARANDGDLVAARVQDWIHIRVLRHDGARIELATGGPEAPLGVGPGDDYAILGVVTTVVRAPREPVR